MDKKTSVNRREGLGVWFGEVYGAYIQEIFTYVAARVYSRQDAEDITAATFEKALRSMKGSSQDKASFGTQLYRIAGEIISDYWREKKRKPAAIRTEDVEWMFEAEPSDRSDDIAWYVDFANCVKGLPEKQQNVLVMRYIVGVPAKRIAKIEGRSEEAVSKKLLRALESFDKVARNRKLITASPEGSGQ